jgi:hypothetical protein
MKHLDAKGIKYEKRVIDIDPLAETDALMYNILSAPALRVNEKVFNSKQLFTDHALNVQKLADIFSEKQPQIAKEVPVGSQIVKETPAQKPSEFKIKKTTKKYVSSNLSSLKQSSFKF